LGDFSKLRKDQFGFDVQATDGLFNAITNVLVYKLTPEIQAMLLSSKRPEFVQWYSYELERQLTALTNWNVSVSGLSQHSERRDLIDPDRTDIFVYAIDQNIRKPVPSSDLVNKLYEVFPTIQSTLQQLRLESIRPASDLLGGDEQMSTAEIALISVCVVIILMAFTGTLLIIRWWRKKSEAIDEHEYMKEYDTRKMGGMHEISSPANFYLDRDRPFPLLNPSTMSRGSENFRGMSTISTVPVEVHRSESSPNMASASSSSSATPFVKNMKEEKTAKFH